MACLLPGSDKSTSAQQCIGTAAGLLQDALRTALGLPQPRLSGLMQVCLHIDHVNHNLVVFLFVTA